MRHSRLIEVKSAPGKGRGVFARRFIESGTVIEKVPILIVPLALISNPENANLCQFFFCRDEATLAVCLGYGSLYNHSYRPNARYDDHGPRCMLFTAIRNIEPGDEITINYNGDPEDTSPMAFDVV